MKTWHGCNKGYTMDWNKDILNRTATSMVDVNLNAIVRRTLNRYGYTDSQIDDAFIVVKPEDWMNEEDYSAALLDYLENKYKTSSKKDDVNAMMGAEVDMHKLKRNEQFGGPTVKVNGVDFNRAELLDMAVDFSVDTRGKSMEDIAKTIEQEIRNSGG